MLRVDALLWLVPPGVTDHQISKWHRHARERLDLACKYLDKRNVAIQAGGNIGIWPFLLVEEYQFKQVYTFEPDIENIRCLKHNVADLPVTCYQSALGSSADTVVGWLQDPKGRPGWHKVAPYVGGGTGQMVTTMTIDEVPIVADYGRVDLVALDVEGYELDALIGAEKTLLRDKPVLIVEDLNKSKFKSFRRLGGRFYGHGPLDLQDWLRERGYRMVEEIKNDEIWVHA